jgi:tetratricopeptide (TPR) repeat protein
MEVLNDSKNSDKFYDSNNNHNNNNLNTPPIPNTCFNFFINENYFKTFNESNDKFYMPYFFKINIENFTNLINYESIKDFLKPDNNILNFETLKVFKFNLIHQGDVYAVYDELYSMEEGKNVILDFIFNRFYLEDPNEMNKIFIVNNNVIVGFLILLKKEGEFLIQKIQRLNLLEKFLTSFHFLKKINHYCNSSNLEVYDLDLRTIFISKKKDFYDDMFILNRKLYVRNFEDFMGNSSFLTKNEKFKQGLIEVFEFMCYLFDIFNFQKYNYKNPFDITIDLLNDFKLVFNNLKIPLKQKSLFFETFRNILESDQASINYENEFNKVKFIIQIIIMELFKTYDLKNYKCKCCEYLNSTYVSEQKTENKEELDSNSSNKHTKITNSLNNSKSKLVNEIYVKEAQKDKTIDEVKDPKYNIGLLSAKSLSNTELEIVKEKSSKLFYEAEHFYEENDFENAKKTYEICLALRLRSSGESSKDTANVLSALAGAELRLGFYKEAMEKYTKAYKIYLAIYGENHLMIGSIMQNIGLCHDLMNQYDTALEYYHRALNMKLLFLSKNHQSTATTYYNIGAIFDIKKKYTDALKYFQIAVDIYNKIYGEENIESASAYNNMGLIYNKLNDTENAINKLNKCLNISSKLLGNNHPLIATCHNNLGLLYVKMNQVENALQNFNQSVKLREKLPELGFKNQNDMPSSYNNLAGVYFKIEEYENARKNYLKSLDLYIKLTGKNSQETASTYNNLGLVYAKMKNYDDALSNFREALEIRKKLFGEDNIQTLSVLSNLTGIHFELNDYRTCIENYLKIYEKFKDFYGENSAELLPIMDNLGHCYSNLKKFNEATIYYEKSLKLALIQFGKNSPPTGESYLNLYRLYQNKGDFDKAEEYSKKYEKLKNNSFIY